MLTVANVLQALRDWAPSELAWDRDNIGLLVGSKNAAVHRSLICLDLTEDVAQEATSLECDLVVAHHPIIFHPLSSILLDSGQGRVLQHCLANNIAVVAVHTNADATFGGLNHALAALLGLTGVRSLSPVSGARELTTLFADPGNGNTEAFFAGLKRIPETTWTAAQFENGLARFEVRSPRWHGATIRGLASSELGGGVISEFSSPINGTLEGYGIGAIGMLPEPVTAGEFIAAVKESLGCTGVRTTPVSDGTMIAKVAVCGGSGSSYIPLAVAAGADVMVTSDVTYHTFQDYKNDILLIDAGHYETERVFIDICRTVLERAFRNVSDKAEFISTRTDTNPVRFA